jgi:hypothetical protein
MQDVEIFKFDFNLEKNNLLLIFDGLVLNFQKKNKTFLHILESWTDFFRKICQLISLTQSKVCYMYVTVTILGPFLPFVPCRS